MVIKYFESIQECGLCKECADILIDQFELTMIAIWGKKWDTVVINLGKEVGAGEGAPVIECETDEDLIIAGKLEETGLAKTKIVNGATYLVVNAMIM